MANRSCYRGLSRPLLQSRSKNRLYPHFWTVQGSLRGAARSFRTFSPIFFNLNVGLELSLSVLFLCINRSLSPLTPLTLRQSSNLRRQRGRWLLDRQQQSEFPAVTVCSSSLSLSLSLSLSIFSFFPPISLRSLFLPSSIPILFAVSALLFTYFFPSIFCFPLGLNIYALD